MVYIALNSHRGRIQRVQHLRVAWHASPRTVTPFHLRPAILGEPSQCVQVMVRGTIGHTFFCAAWVPPRKSGLDCLSAARFQAARSAPLAALEMCGREPDHDLNVLCAH